MVNHDAGRARLLWELECFGLSGTLVLHADVCQLSKVASFLARAVRDVADQHAETRLEGCYFGGLRGAEESVGHVVYNLHAC